MHSSKSPKPSTGKDKKRLLGENASDSSSTPSDFGNTTVSKSTSPGSIPLSPISPTSDSKLTGIAAIVANRRSKRNLTNEDDMSNIDEVLAAQQRKNDDLLQERELFIQKWWKITMACVCASGVWILFYLGLRFGFDINDLVRKDIKDYGYSDSLFDLALLVCIDCFFVLLANVTTFSDDERSDRLSITGYWVSAISFLLTISKAIVLEGWSDGATAVLIMMALLLTSGLFLCQTNMAPLASKSDWDPYEADEAAASLKRKAKNEELVKEAAEKTESLELQLASASTDEEKDSIRAQLDLHIQKEKDRVLAEEFIEKQAAKAKIASKEKQEMLMSEYFILLKPYFWPEGGTNRIIVFLTWVALIASKASSILSPLFIGYATNQLVHEGTVPWLYISVYCVLQFCSTMFKQIQSAIYLKVKQEAFAQLSKLTFVHVHSLSLRWHTKKKLGNLLRSLDRGINSADTLVSYLFLYLLPSLVECIVVFIIFFVKFNQPVLSSIMFFHLVIYCIITVQITIWRKKFRRATNKHDNEFHDRATDSLINYETVKYFNNEEYETDKYIDAVRKYQKYSISTQMSLAMLNTMQSFIIQASLLVSLLSTAYHISNGEMSIGDFTAVNSYTINLFAPLAWLGSIYDSLCQSVVDLQNLSELLNEEPDVIDKVNAAPLTLRSKRQGAKLEFRDVCFSYGDQKENKGITGVSFTVNPGTTTAIVGTTGAGKSTILRLLFRFYDVKSGSIEIDGQNIADVTQKSLRNVVGVVPQSTVMFNDSVYHNIQYGNLNASRSQIEAACKQAQILDFILGLPAQFDTKVGERGLRLSGGEAQRCSIARALLKDPPIVLLDEATSALDTTTEQEIQSALRNLESNRTTVVIAHRLSTVKHADQIIVLDSGRIIEKGTHTELIELRGKYAELWNQQASEVVTHPDGYQKPSTVEITEVEEGSSQQ